MSASNARPVVERVFCVTTRTVCGEVELRDEVLQYKLVLGNLELFGIVLYSLMQLDGPTACNIVRNLDNLDLLIFHGR